MKIHTSDKLIAWLTLFSGLSVSAVAIYYSVAGLTAIFAAAVIPIIVMGVVLEISKLAATVWLKQNWTRAPNFIRGYLLLAIAILMLITSMGIFGYLSKAHSDQSLVSGDVKSKIAIYDEKIKIAKDNIDANRKALRQMDEAVDQVMGRSNDEKGADKAVQIRRSQLKERARLQAEIQAEQKTISNLTEERAPIAAEVRKVEAEVGPVKYIAAFIYGDNPDANILEKAVTWVIIIIVIVFDPLAVILLLASQYSFQWFRKQQEITEGDSPTSNESVDSPTVTTDDIPQEEKADSPNLAAGAFWPFPRIWHKDTDPNVFEAIKHNEKVQEAPYHPGYEDVTVKDDAGMDESEIENKDLESKLIDEANTKLSEIEKEVDVDLVLDSVDDSDEFLIDNAVGSEKDAMKQWKHDNPESSLKHQRRLFEKGIIKELPWEKYLKPEADFDDNEAAAEAAKWAMEQIEKQKSKNSDERPGDYLSESEEIKKKDSDMVGETGSNAGQKNTLIPGYVQNAEQTESTLWQRVHKSKGDQ